MNNKLTTPEDLNSPSLNFARALNPNSQLFYVPVSPNAGALVNECYSNVDDMVRQSGGKKILGWQIWEWPGFFAEAESHAVWESPDYELYDVTPKIENKIAFIPDPNVSFTGARINNVRSALTDTEVVHDFIKAGELKHKIFGHIKNGTQLEAWQVLIGGRLDSAIAVLPNLFQANGRISQKCPCGSGLGYADCHRPEIKRTFLMADKLLS